MLGLESRLGTIDATGRLNEYNVPGSSDGVTSVTPSADGSVWFFEYGESRVARLDVAGHITHFGTQNRFQTEFRLAPDGTLWAADFDGGSVAHINPGGAVYAYELSHAEPGGENAQIAVGDAGEVLHTSYGSGGIARISEDGSIVEAGLFIPQAQKTGPFILQ